MEHLKDTTAATDLKCKVLEYDGDKIDKETLYNWIDQTIEKERQQIVKAVTAFNKALQVYEGVHSIIIDNDGEQYYKFIYS